MHFTLVKTLCLLLELDTVSIQSVCYCEMVEVRLPKIGWKVVTADVQLWLLTHMVSMALIDVSGVCVSAFCECSFLHFSHVSQG